MNVPTEYELSDTVSYFKEKKNNYFLIVKISSNFFLIRCDYTQCNIFDIFGWLNLQQKIYESSDEKNPINCVIDQRFTTKYKSLLSSIYKIENLIKFIREYRDFDEIKIECPRSTLKMFVKTIVNIKTDNCLNLYENIEPDINIKNLNSYDKDVKVIGIFKDYRMFDFLLTYEVPFISYQSKEIYIFTEKNLNKFIIDIKFLYNIFYNISVRESFLTLTMIKESLQRNIKF